MPLIGARIFLPGATRAREASEQRTVQAESRTAPEVLHVAWANRALRTREGGARGSWKSVQGPSLPLLNNSASLIVNSELHPSAGRIQDDAEVSTLESGYGRSLCLVDSNASLNCPGIILFLFAISFYDLLDGATSTQLFRTETCFAIEFLQQASSKRVFRTHNACRRSQGPRLRSRRATCQREDRAK